MLSPLSFSNWLCHFDWFAFLHCDCYFMDHMELNAHLLWETNYVWSCRIAMCTVQCVSVCTYSNTTEYIIKFRCGAAAGTQKFVVNLMNGYWLGLPSFRIPHTHETNWKQSNQCHASVYFCGFSTFVSVLQLHLIIVFSLGRHKSSSRWR